jgi:hypothetical protein
MVTLTLNSAARGQDKFNLNGKIRAKVKDGTMLIRPTSRRTPVNLPKDERLVDVHAGKFELDGLDSAAGSFSLQPEKYGWFAMVSGHTGRGPAVKVA